MLKVFIDTGIFVNVLNKEPGYEKSALLLEKVFQGKLGAFISVITLSEILSIYYRISERDAIVAKTYIEDIFDENRIIPVMKSIAETAGKIKAKHKMSLGGAVILASAVSLGCDFIVSLDPEMNTNLMKMKEPKDLIYS